MKLKHFNLSFGTQIFKSFSDESRTRIMHLLFRVEELSISDIETILEFTQTKTSRHMAYLKNAGNGEFTAARSVGFYSLRDESLNMVSQIFSFLEKDQLLQHDLDVYETLKANRELAISKIKAKGYQK